MRTFKRNTPEIEDDIDNYTKYFNQLEFKGIVEDDNLYTLDQESFKDCKNVYINSSNRLASRPTLQKDNNLPDKIKSFIDYYRYNLIDIRPIGTDKIYVIQDLQDNTYKVIVATTIIVEDENQLMLEDLPHYHIATIDHYAICFNDREDLGAQVYDTNNPNNYWTSINEYIDIPVIKRVVGSTESSYDKNGFTSSYKEEYVWSNESYPILPSGNAEITVNTASQKLEWGQIENADKLPEYRILKKANLTVEDGALVTSAKDRICVAYEDYFLLSADDGLTFSKHYYPIYQGTYKNIASISKDGNYFFFVTSYGVYRCNLGDYTWANVDRANSGISATQTTNQELDIKGHGQYNMCYFLTGDTYCFRTYDEIQGATWVYAKGPGLAGFNKKQATDEDGNSLNLLYLIHNDTPGVFDDNKLAEDWGASSMYMYITQDVTGVKDIAVIAWVYTGVSQGTVLYYVRGENANRFYVNPDDGYNYSRFISLPYYYANISKLKDDTDNTGTNQLQLIIDYAGADNTSWKIIQASLTETYKSGEVLGFTYKELVTVDTKLSFSLSGEVYLLEYGYLNDTGSNIQISYTENDIQYLVDLPKSYKGGISNIWTDRQRMWVDGSSFYIVGGDGSIYTNNLADTDTAVITYTYSSDNKFLKVPDVSYSDTELYLGFGKLLQITANSKDGTTTKFNLPSINDQSFISPITGLLNISTSQTAIFFNDKISICAKVEDENLTSGYRYDYYNTKLSTGIRLGDGAINTLEGSYTLFPTLRGLAAMNYQAFMATTDQTLQYLSDNIKEIWENFYKNSTVIKMIQWRTKLIITNGTGEILLFDFNNNTWWKWEVPVETEIALTDQIDLQLIDLTEGRLTIFKDQKEETKNGIVSLTPQYYDFSEIGEFKDIDWYILSQPLHMKAPNYYKNIRQLTFQFYEDSENRTQKTMNAQVKLYRKNITLRAPETIKFTIENLRTFVKRFNYWKVNEIQWGLANDTATSTPKPFEINGLSVKYEIGEEVR